MPLGEAAGTYDVSMEAVLVGLFLIAVGGVGTWLVTGLSRTLRQRFQGPPLELRFAPVWVNLGLTAVGPADLAEDSGDGFSVPTSWDSSAYLAQTPFGLSVTNRSDQGLPRTVVIEELHVDIVGYEALDEAVSGLTLLHWTPMPMGGDMPESTWPDHPFRGPFTVVIRGTEPVSIPLFALSGPSPLGPLTLGPGRRVYFDLRLLFEQAGRYEFDVRMTVSQAGRRRDLSVQTGIRVLACSDWDWIEAACATGFPGPRPLEGDELDDLLRSYSELRQRLFAAFPFEPYWANDRACVHPAIEPPTATSGPAA